MHLRTYWISSINNNIDEILLQFDKYWQNSYKEQRAHKTASINFSSFLNDNFLQIRVVLQSGYIFKKLHSSPVLTIEAYFDFKVLLSKHWSGLGLRTAIKRRLESINFSKEYAHS